MKSEINGGIVTLWMIVGFMALIIFMLVFVNHVGYGRWECIEYKNICNSCEINGSIPLKVENEELSINWRVVGEDSCVCTDYEEVCTKEAWINKIDETN